MNFKENVFSKKEILLYFQKKHSIALSKRTIALFNTNIQLTSKGERKFVFSKRNIQLPFQVRKDCLISKKKHSIALSKGKRVFLFPTKAFNCPFKFGRLLNFQKENSILLNDFLSDQFLVFLHTFWLYSSSSSFDHFLFWNIIFYVFPFLTWFFWSEL